MSLIAAGETPCWELSHEAEEEWRPHYVTELEALHALARRWNEEREEFLASARPGETFAEEWPDLVSSAADQMPEKCWRLVCDGCGLADGMDGELVDVDQGTHYPNDGRPEWLDQTADWVVLDGGRLHLCDVCAVGAPDLEDPRRPGPDDVPLFDVQLSPISARSEALAAEHHDRVAQHGQATT